MFCTPTQPFPRQFAASLLLLLCGGLHAQTPWPDAAPDVWGLAILDVETTGLEPGHHEMIDIGLIYTTLDGTELDRLFLRIHPRHPERAGEIARSINGYSETRWKALGAVEPAMAVQRILEVHERQAEHRRFILTAYNAPFDQAFLDALLDRHGSSVRDLYTYFVLDLPSMAFGLGVPALVNARVAERFGIEPETDDPLEHTGLSGAEWNLALYRAMRAESTARRSTGR
ncbi:exonuclease domain-containing protein [Halomonas denitrificans]|nr:hypothetical protein [Halomonas denitrificans]